MDLKDQILSFLLGIGLAALLIVDSFACFAGERTHIKGMKISPHGIMAVGLLELGMGLCVHALFFRPYDNHPLMKSTLVVVGVGLVLLSFVWLVV